MIGHSYITPLLAQCHLAIIYKLMSPFYCVCIIMSSSKTSNCLKLAQQIRTLGFINSNPYEYCENFGCMCFTMSDQLKCSKCTYRGQSYVAILQERIEKLYLKLKNEVELVKAEQNQLLEQLDNLCALLKTKRKILEQPQKQIERQIQCLIQEMKADEEDLTQIVITVSQLKADLFSFPNPF